MAKYSGGFQGKGCPCLEGKPEWPSESIGDVGRYANYGCRYLQTSRYFLTPNPIAGVLLFAISAWFQVLLFAGAITFWVAHLVLIIAGAYCGYEKENYFSEVSACP